MSSEQGADAVKPLGVRLSEWAPSRGWAVELEIQVQDPHWIARCGPHVGYGRTTNEAIDHLADGLVEEGWSDDRPPEDDDPFDLGGFWSEPTVGYCSKCGEARSSFYTCRGGGETVASHPATEEGDHGA